MRNSTRVIFGLAGTAALLGSFALPASAAESTTTTTVSGGVVSIAAPASFTLPAVKPGATTSNSLVGVKVTDERAGTSGWTSSVVISDFQGVIPTGGTAADANTIAATNVTYTPGTATVTGTATVAAAAAAANISAATTVQTATAVNGNNTATWDATVAVTAPSDALADDYTATMTHSAA